MALKHGFLIIGLFSVLNCKSQFSTINVFPPNPYEHVIPTVLFTAGNGVFIARNIIKMQGADHGRSNAGFGLITGTAQLAYGVLYAGDESGYTSEIAVIDITVGLATIVTSTVRLLKKQPPAPKPVSLTVTSLRNYCTGKPALGFSLRGNF